MKHVRSKQQLLGCGLVRHSGQARQVRQVKQVEQVRLETIVSRRSSLVLHLSCLGILMASLSGCMMQQRDPAAELAQAIDPSAENMAKVCEDTRAMFIDDPERAKKLFFPYVQEYKQASLRRSMQSILEMIALSEAKSPRSFPPRNVRWLLKAKAPICEKLIFENCPLGSGFYRGLSGFSISDPTGECRRKLALLEGFESYMRGWQEEGLFLSQRIDPEFAVLGVNDKACIEDVSWQRIRDDSPDLDKLYNAAQNLCWSANTPFFWDKLDYDEDDYLFNAQLAMRIIQDHYEKSVRNGRLDERLDMALAWCSLDGLTKDEEKERIFYRQVVHPLGQVGFSILVPVVVAGSGVASGPFAGVTVPAAALGAEVANYGLSMTLPLARLTKLEERRWNTAVLTPDQERCNMLGPEYWRSERRHYIELMAFDSLWFGAAMALQLWVIPGLGKFFSTVTKFSWNKLKAGGRFAQEQAKNLPKLTTKKESNKVFMKLAGKEVEIAPLKPLLETVEKILNSGIVKVPREYVRNILVEVTAIYATLIAKLPRIGRLPQKNVTQLLDPSATTKVAADEAASVAKTAASEAASNAAGTAAAQNQSQQAAQAGIAAQLYAGIFDDLIQMVSIFANVELEKYVRNVQSTDNLEIVRVFARPVPEVSLSSLPALLTEPAGDLPPVFDDVDTYLNFRDAYRKGNLTGSEARLMDILLSWGRNCLGPITQDAGAAGRSGEEAAELAARRARQCLGFFAPKIESPFDISIRAFKMRSEVPRTSQLEFSEDLDDVYKQALTRLASRLRTHVVQANAEFSAIYDRVVKQLEAEKRLNGESSDAPTE